MGPVCADLCWQNLAASFILSFSAGKRKPPFPYGFMIAVQDFILKIRRLHRLNTPQLVLNVMRQLSDYSAGEPDAVETGLKELARRLSGEAHIMENGDLFLLFGAMEGAQRKSFLDNFAVLLPAGSGASFHAYGLPQDYDALRERANVYADLARADELMGKNQQAEAALQADDVRGPLTAWSLAQVEKLLESTDIRRYVRTQPVYCQSAQGVWDKHRIDFYISIADLKQARFPRLNLSTPERLFLELCYTLDRKLLLELAGQSDPWLDRNISLNLSAETVLSGAFAQFCHVLPKARRGQVFFEFHRSELFLNFTTTRNAMDVLRDEGFGVGIDGITASVLPFINFGLLDVDYYKVNVTREKWAGMDTPEVIRTLQALPNDKLVFSHCDHDEALRLGQRLGVRYYQGWLIDDVAGAIPS